MCCYVTLCFALRYSKQDKTRHDQKDQQERHVKQDKQYNMLLFPFECLYCCALHYIALRSFSLLCLGYIEGRDVSHDTVGFALLCIACRCFAVYCLR